MPRRLLILNILLGALSCFFAVVLIREVLVVHPLPPPPVLRPAPSPSPPLPTTAPEAVAAYGAIAAKNLFSPSRSEMIGDAVVAGPTPVLHGVVMNGEKTRASSPSESWAMRSGTRLAVAAYRLSAPIAC